MGNVGTRDSTFFSKSFEHVINIEFVMPGFDFFVLLAWL